MGIFSGIRGIFSKEQPVFKEKKTIYTQTTGKTTVWSPRDYENFAKETYMKNVISFRCMDLIAKAISSVPWKMFQKTINNGRDIVEDHYVAKLIKRPNPEESWNYLMTEYILYLLISGNAFFYRISPDAGPNMGVAKELCMLRPDKMRIKTNEDGTIRAYEFNEKKIIPVDPITRMSDVLHVKMFNPIDEYYGMAITEPIAREVDSSNQSAEWQMRMLQNEGKPGMVITVNGALTTEQFDRLEKKMKELHSGVANAGRTLILESADTIKAEPYGWSPKEMDWIDSNREMARRIALGYAIPPQMLGIPGDNTYSNMKEARMSFYEDTIFPYLEKAKGELNHWFFPNEEKYFVDFVTDKLSALAPKRESQWKTAQNSDFLTINEKREIVGYDEIEGGDVLFVAANMLPLDMALDPTRVNDANVDNNAKVNGDENSDEDD